MKTWRGFFIICLLAWTPVSFALNGNLLISGSPSGQSLGGTGVSHFTSEFDAMYANAAMLGKTRTKVGESAMTVALLLSKGEIRANNGVTDKMFPAESPYIFLPLAGYFKNFSEKIKFGISFFMLSASGQSFEDHEEMGNVRSENVSFRFTNNVSYSFTKDFHVGFSPDLLYSFGKANAAGTNNEGGRSYDFVWKVGFVYDISEKTTVGASFSKGADFELDDFVDVGPLTTTTSDDAHTDADPIDSSVPDFLSIGVTQRFLKNKLAFILEYRRIAWSKANFYDDLGAKDQNVYMIAMDYAANEHWNYRLGFNYAKKPYDEVSGENGAEPVGFGRYTVPRQVASLTLVRAISPTEMHITGGVGYKWTNHALDTSLNYSLKEETHRSGSTAGVPYDYKLDFWLVTVGAAYSYYF